MVKQCCNCKLIEFPRKDTDYINGKCYCILIGTVSEDNWCQYFKDAKRTLSDFEE